MSSSGPPHGSLPIEAVLEPLIAALTARSCVVLQAATGAGKTTRVPPALLAAGLAPKGQRILVLEPRRVAARAAARRIAAEIGCQVGEAVGYHIRFDRRASDATRILFLTEGVLLRRLQADPFLEGVGAVVFDEFHERRLDADLALAMTLRVQREVRQDLKLIVMSATLDPGPLAEYLRDAEGPASVITSAGRLHPVELRYQHRPREGSFTHHGPERAAAGVRDLLADASVPPGDILVFLPGVGEIQRTATLLEGVAAQENLLLTPLYGDLAPEAQDRALLPADRRKVVLATNVAETSVTIEGVTAVVDTGLARVLRHDPRCGLDRLELTRISRAAADQRAGRAGRQQPGLCLRLWTSLEHQALAEREVAEVHRRDLAGPTLQLLAWGERDPGQFPWFEAPDPAALERARELLHRLGAVGPQGLTSLGRIMAGLPVHPRLGRLLLEGQRHGQGRQAALLAALLAERPPFRRRRGRAEGQIPALHPSRSDLLDQADLLERFARTRHAPESPHGELIPGAAHHVLKSRGQLAGLLPSDRSGKRPTPEGDEPLLRALLAAYPDRVARRREPGSPRGVLVGGRGVRLAPSSAVQGPELFLCADLDAGRRGELAEAWVRLASEVRREWLPEALLEVSLEVEFDRSRDRVMAFRRTRYLDLVIDETEEPAPADRAAEVLAAAAAQDVASALDLDRPEVAAFLARLRSLAHWRPELELPTFDEAALGELLPMLAAGKRSLAALRRAPLLEVLQGTLTFPQRQALDQEAPERLAVPSGSHIRLRYAVGEPPVLAARIQELFGLRETPRVAGGRVPVLLHLLAPNMRPQQVTQDLESFWRTTYPQVRKELQGRYPKHAWPEDPLTAQAMRGARRRR